MHASFIRKRSPLPEDMSLQITSMADIFIIILVFLLKSYASGAMNLSPSKDVKLPMGLTQDLSVEALKIEVGENAVQVEGQAVAELKGYRFEVSDLEGAGISKSLVKSLEFQRQRQLLIAKSNSDVKIDPKVIILADQRVPYATIKSVLASAAVQGYTDFKLAVVKGD